MKKIHIKLEQLCRTREDGTGFIYGYDIYCYAEVKKKFKRWIEDKFKELAQSEYTDYNPVEVFQDNGDYTKDYELSRTCAEIILASEDSAKGEQFRAFLESRDAAEEKNALEIIENKVPVKAVKQTFFSRVLKSLSFIKYKNTTEEN